MRWLTVHHELIYPHGRREHMSMKFAVLFSFGSSLRAQGTPSTSPITQDSSRFIPAGAGNTMRNQQLDISKTVHPCGRREHSSRKVMYGNKGGSSLRAQGTLSGF